jgi:hypothetical protein
MAAKHWTRARDERLPVFDVRGKDEVVGPGPSLIKGVVSERENLRALEIQNTTIKLLTNTSSDFKPTARLVQSRQLLQSPFLKCDDLIFRALS